MTIKKENIVPGLVVRLKSYKEDQDYFDGGKKMLKLGNQKLIATIKNIHTGVTREGYLCFSLSSMSWNWRNIDIVKVNTIQDTLT